MIGPRGSTTDGYPVLVPDRSGLAMITDRLQLGASIDVATVAILDVDGELSYFPFSTRSAKSVLDSLAWMEVEGRARLTGSASPTGREILTAHFALLCPIAAAFL
ncbi:hypothetical protein PIB30_087121 [Stylosanthes scabra]|uniref:Uncharacterized protein n=1 Tax=Stylosanthes scabra TaxID=79078 RepID=A0ABU6QVN2_9FABA|nr:hypothetical protein [Stylosanthes scabra]